LQQRKSASLLSVNINLFKQQPLKRGQQPHYSGGQCDDQSCLLEQTGERSTCFALKSPPLLRNKKLLKLKRGAAKMKK